MCYLRTCLYRCEIRRRAYFRYVERGRQDGHALDDWLQAERDVFAGMDGTAIDIVTSLECDECAE